MMVILVIDGRESYPLGADPGGDNEVVVGVVVGGQVAGGIRLDAVEEHDPSLYDAQTADDAVL
jgi:hypothetical protein